MYSNISVQDFLKSLDCNIEVKQFKNHVINCNHLMRFPRISSSVLKWAYKNRCAILLPPLCQGADLAIVTKLVNHDDSELEQYGLILIQAKNYTAKLTQVMVQDFLDSCLPSSFLSYNDSLDFKNVISIVAAAGQAGCHKVEKWTYLQRRSPRLHKKKKGNKKPDYDRLQLSVSWNNFVELSDGIRSELLKLAGKFQKSVCSDVPSDSSVFSIFGPSGGLLVLDMLKDKEVDWKAILDPTHNI